MFMCIYIICKLNEYVDICGLWGQRRIHWFNSATAQHPLSLFSRLFDCWQFIETSDSTLFAKTHCRPETSSVAIKDITSRTLVSGPNRCLAARQPGLLRQVPLCVCVFFFGSIPDLLGIVKWYIYRFVGYDWLTTILRVPVIFSDAPSWCQLPGYIRSPDMTMILGNTIWLFNIAMENHHV